MTGTVKLSRSDVANMLTSVLTRPATEGARIVTLHWLLQLDAARADWEQSSDAEALHRARVALRRLRASIKTHKSLLRGSHPTRLLNAMTRLQRATNAARDADVSTEWLLAESEGLPRDGQTEAAVMLERLREGAESRRARVGSAWKRHLDSLIGRAANRLSAYRVNARLGDAPPMNYAAHLADTIERSISELRAELEALTDVEIDHLPQALHHVRIHLKRQRAMLSPHTAAHPALAAWYAMATRGQDVLGAMRDAAVLGSHARYDGADALADVLNDVAVARQESFLGGWCGDLDVIRCAQLDAVAALRMLAQPTTASGLPMEYERKYLLSGCPPDAAAAPSSRIDQGWIPGTALRERLRRSVAADGSVRYTRTVKLGPATARIEVEEDTDATLFDAMWPLTVQARIRKRRYVVREGEYRWEIDVFLDRDLVVAEIELRHEFDTVDVPTWLAPYIVRDVTGEVQYFNAVLARAERGDERTSDQTSDRTTDHSAALAT